MSIDAGFSLIAKDDDIVEGNLYGVSVRETPLLLVRLEGVIRAIGRICTHEFADLAEGQIEDGCVVCPLHGSKFDIMTGRALTLPAVEAEPVYEVIVRDGAVYVAVPCEPVD
ncbi:MAG TPA: Rieske 2Fe-2S domain-containing protein [Candidatus Baltobacteraceae bacterium]|nr:Rieske 2Fe-2S domain-containing protein [Candidatus Baltobacteraceae bacterium]